MTDSPLHTATLHDFLDRMKAGDSAASDDLLRRVCARLERLTHKMLRGYPAVQGWVQTDDVLQNALLRLLRSLREIRPASTRDFFGLAAEQVRRELLDLARRYRSRRGLPANQIPAPDDPRDRAGDPPDSGPEPDDLERWRRFHQEVEKLPAEEREVVGLIFYHGGKQAEAAEVLRVSERTVRRRWEAALVKLRHILQDESPQE